MNQRMVPILPAICVIAWLAMDTAKSAESPFIGEWQLDSAKTRLPDEMKVERQGVAKYAFDFGGATETIVVDGTDQPGYGGTLLSVTAEAPDVWIVQRKKDDRLQIKATWKLSKDGKTLTDNFRGLNPDGSPLSMDYVYRRANEGSGFAGDWKSIEETMTSPMSMQVKAFQGDGLSFITPSQRTTRNVKLDGKDYPKEGPNAPPGASFSARRVDDRAMAIVDHVGEKVSDTEEIALSADLKTLTMTVHVPGRDKPSVLVFERK